MNTTENHPTEKSSGPGLPVEPDAESPILTSSHIFMIEIASVSESPWKREADDLEHRELKLAVKLLNCWKGSLGIKPGDLFDVSIDQRRISMYMPLEDPDLWSDREPQVGEKFIVFALSEGQPAAMMKEPDCRGLYSPDYRTDVEAAIAAENVYTTSMKNSAGSDDPQLKSTRDLLAFTRSLSTPVRDFFALFVWDRVNGTFLKHPMLLLDELIGLISDPSRHLDFRITLLDSMDDTLHLEELDPEIMTRVLREYFKLLSNPSLEDLHEDLAEDYIYHMIFDDDDETNIKSREIFPDAGQRKRYANLLRPFDEDTAGKVIRWLK